LKKNKAKPENPTLKNKKKKKRKKTLVLRFACVDKTQGRKKMTATSLLTFFVPCEKL